MESSPVANLSTKQLITMLATIMALGALGIDLMLPIFDDVRAHFGLAPADTSVAKIVTAYFLGMAFGQLLYGPFADRFGRRPILYIGLAVYLVAAIGSALAPSLSIMLVTRLVWGVGAAGSRVAALAVIRDVYSGEDMARTMSFIMAVFVLVPIFAPSIGAVIAALGAWQLVFWFAAIYAAVTMIWVRRLPETLAAENRRRLQLRPVVEAGREVLSNRTALGYTLAMTFWFGAFTSYLASSELIVGEIYGRGGQFPIIFGGVAMVMGSAMLFNAAFVTRFGVTRIVRGAVRGYMVLSVGLLALTLATSGLPPFWIAVAWLSAILVMHAAMIPNVNTAALEPLGHIAGTAAAVIGTISLAGGALLGSLIDGRVTGTITPLVVGFVAYGAIAAAWVAWAERPVSQPESVI